MVRAVDELYVRSAYGPENGERIVRTVIGDAVAPLTIRLVPRDADG